eukprot:9019141-Pyramimonas_sp.AAC.1
MPDPTQASNPGGGHVQILASHEGGKESRRSALRAGSVWRGGLSSMGSRRGPGIDFDRIV